MRLLLMVLTAVWVASSPALAQEYSYPYRDPYLATVTGAALNADGLTPGIKRQVVHVSILPDRDKLPKLEGKGELSVALYQQKRAAPLVFILPGTGSTPYFGLATYFAKLFYQDGAHAGNVDAHGTDVLARAAEGGGMGEILDRGIPVEHRGKEDADGPRVRVAVGMPADLTVDGTDVETSAAA